MGSTSSSLAGHPVFGRVLNNSVVTLVIAARSVQCQSDHSSHMKSKGMLIASHLRMVRYSSTCVPIAISNSLKLLNCRKNYRAFCRVKVFCEC